MPDYFDFIIYLAFETGITYEEVRKLSIQQLHEYRMRLIDKHIDYHKKFNNYSNPVFGKRLEYFHARNLAMTPTEELETLFKFVSDNSRFFGYQNGVVFVKNGVSAEMIQDAKYSLPSYRDEIDDLLCEELVDFGDSIACLNAIGATKLKNIIYGIINDEKEVERAYCEGSLEKIRKMVKSKGSFVDFRLRLIGNFNTTKLSCCDRILYDFCAIDEDAAVYEVWPLSADLMEKDPFYSYCSYYFATDFDSCFQRAIFDTASLTYDKLCDGMRVLWAWRDNAKYGKQVSRSNADFEVDDNDEFCEYEEKSEQLYEIDDDENEDYIEDEFDPEGEYELLDYADESEKLNPLQKYELEKNRNLIFYLTYIKELDSYMKSCGTSSELNSTRNRLLYLLDAYDHNLYEPNNLRYAIDTLDEVEFNDDGSFYCISREFLLDTLEEYDEKFSSEMKVKKIIFATAYYSLTGDHRIERMASKYENTPMGKMVSKAVFNHDYGDFNREIGKKLIKSDN